MCMLILYIRHTGIEKTKENAEIINHLHEIYSNICKELEATIYKQGMKRNIRMRTFF